MNGKQPLALYRELLPILNMQRRKFEDGEVGYTMLHQLDEVAIFDCRELPTAFVDDTGDAVFEELQRTKDMFRLPFGYCYFEFADEPRMIYAEESIHYEVDNETFEKDIESMTFETPPADADLSIELEIYDLSANASFDGIYSAFVFGTPPYYIPPNEKFEFYTVLNPPAKYSAERWELVGRRVLAVATLLSEQLLIDRERPDPTPRISRERRRTQKLPVSGDSHILTINVPVVRYQASRNEPQGGTHAPPALHWRRGHERIYHRDSDAEKTGWVRRHLVGDPAKGYLRKTQYRLVHREVL